MATDKRVQRTQKALREALLSLMKEKPIDLITTTELCERAGINRNTFYAHYSSPFVLLESIEDEYIAVVLDIAERAIQTADYGSLLRQTCEVMYDNQELSSVLLSKNGNRNYLDRFIGTMHEHVIDLWSISLPSLGRDDMELVYYYTTFGVQKCIQQWAEGGFCETPEELAGKLTRMTEFMLAHYLTEEAI